MKEAKELKPSRKTHYTRMALRSSLVDLMAQKPITRITITELCEKADINRTTFYAHYKDQYDLLRQMEEETIADFEAMLTKYENKYSKKETLQMLEEMLRYIANNSNSIQVLLSENGDVYFQKRLFRRFLYRKQVLAYFTEVSQDTETKFPNEMLEYHSFFVINGAIGVIQYWLKNNMNIPATELAKMLVNLTYMKRE
jgi:AcrR family transcriptional regulator